MTGNAIYRVYLCGGPHCTARGREILRRALEDALWLHQLGGQVELYDSGCQDRCDFGPNCAVWPGPYRYSSLHVDAVTRIVTEHLRDGQPVAEYLSDESQRRS